MTDSTEVAQYSQTGLAVQEDGTDLGDMWMDDEYKDELAEEVEAEGGDAINKEEKQLMADRHEPFAISDLYTMDSQFKQDNGQPGTRSVWKITCLLEDGKERVMFLGEHDQRDRACVAIKVQISKSKKPVKNVMLKVSFISQGNPFFVLRPWDGVVQSGLGGGDLLALRLLLDQSAHGIT